MAIEDYEVDGLVLREVKTGEADKILTVLTGKRGKITVNAKGTVSLRSRFASSAQLFTYSTFLLRRKGSFNYIRDTVFLESFEGIRYDLEKLSLANYIGDVAADLAQEDMEDEDFLSLVLNTLYALANRDLPLEQIKGAFEFRAAIQAGFMPDLTACGLCGCEPAGDCSLDVMNGRILCKKCRAVAENTGEYANEDPHSKIMIRLSPSVLAALRYIEGATVKRFLSFKLDEQELSLFSVVCERYLLNHIEHGFSSLEYYKKIKI